MTPASLKRTAAAGLLALATVGATLGAASAQQLSTIDPGIAPGPDTPALVAQGTGQPRQPGQPGRPGRGEGDGQGQRPQLTDEQRQQLEQQRQAAEQRYIDLLAKNLGLDSATVKSALEQTQKDLQAQRVSDIQQAVTDGKLTQDQADQMIQRMQQGGGPMMGPGFGGPGGGPGFVQGGPGGPGAGR
jgi:hypothetical protein